VKQIILGTAGHIDHGKTSLIRAMTGIETDRLKEEKLRGITIELGFAFLDLPSGQHVGIVDVPGHEKFVKNMVAGATGIDLVAMVIAADEGVMPQTREHLEICTLLGVTHGLIVLTKIDMVEEEWLELVTEDIQDFVRGTFLENTPVCAVSSTNGQGIPEFINTLDELCATVPSKTDSGLFRLPVDRVFSMKGFGTVITGSLISGKIRVGDTIMIYPSKITSKLRGIQVHNESVTEAVAGFRTAVNFQGLDKSAVSRGDVISLPKALSTSYMVDVQLQHLKSNKKAFKNRTRIRFHSGTSEILGVVILLDRDELLPGETTVAQIRLDSPVALVRDDRFVARSYSPVRTIGGGYILNPIPVKHKRFKKETVVGLDQMQHMTAEQLIDHHALESVYSGVSFPQLKIMCNLSDKQIDTHVQKMLSKKQLVVLDRDNRLYIHRQTIDKLKKETETQLTAYHKLNPLKSGMSKEELKSKFPPAVGAKHFNLLLNQLISDKTIVLEEDSVRLSSHQISLGADDTEIRNNLLKIYRHGGLTPPNFKEIVKELGIDPHRVKNVLMLLVSQGMMVKVSEELYFDAEAINNLKNRLVEFLKKNEEISTPDFKQMTGVSRKYLIPLIEHFDDTNVTLRIGDIRKLRSR
jgi:selenocysteine-specific elongation factor